MILSSNTDRSSKHATYRHEAAETESGTVQRFGTASRWIDYSLLSGDGRNPVDVKPGIFKAIALGAVQCAVQHADLFSVISGYISSVDICMLLSVHA
jgi:hypothetical protein